jgi:signal transduction histidine kinase
MQTQRAETLEAFDGRLRKWFSIHLYPAPEALTVFAQDITAIKQAQDALVRSEKLAAVGRMASTVAHEINNPLEAVTNLIWIARHDPSASETVRKNLGIADDELRRVSHIAKKTLGFYRDASAPGAVNMREVLGGVVGLYGSRLRSKQILLRTEYAEADVVGYAGELRQLFSNLFANAVDAVPTKGMLVVRVSNSRDWNSSGQRGVRVTIADNGCGIAPDHLEKLFEPFFTTKSATGTGLGLWVAKQIVEKHGGRISLRTRTSPERHYTIVSVFLPAGAAGARQEYAVAG